MSDEQRTNIIEIVKQLGFPTVVAGVLLWIGNGQIELAGKRFDDQQLFITTTLTTQIEKSNAVLMAINDTLKRLADEQSQTRDVLREVQHSQPSQ